MATSPRASWVVYVRFGAGLGVVRSIADDGLDEVALRGQGGTRQVGLIPFCARPARGGAPTCHWPLRKSTESGAPLETSLAYRSYTRGGGDIVGLVLWHALPSLALQAAHRP